MNQNNMTKDIFKLGFQKLSQNLILVFLIFLFFDFILGGGLFWRYGLKVEENKLKIAPATILNQALLDKFSLICKEKEIILQELNNKVFVDPFNRLKLEEPLLETEGTSTVESSSTKE